MTLREVIIPGKSWAVPEKQEDRFGWFHVWAGTSERAYALIELKDGSILDVNQEEFRFLEPPEESAP